MRLLVWRTARRPCGNSARLWKKVGAEDPYALPPDFPKSEHRTVYASGRFVRIDHAEKKPASPGKGVPKAAPPPKSPAPNPASAKAKAPSAGKAAQEEEDPVKAAAKAAATEKFRELSERIQQKAAQKNPKGPPTQQHTPSQSRAPQAPKAPERAKHAAPGPSRTAPQHAGIALPASAGKGAADFDRTPKIIQHAPPTTPAGRMRAQKAGIAPKAPAPPPQPQKHTAPPAPQKAPSPPPAAAKAAQESPPAFKNDPPRPAPAPRPSEQPGPSHAPPALAKATPTGPKSSKELKVGQEINIPQLELPKGALNKLGAASVVPLRRATKVEEAPPPEPSTAPKAPVQRAPPLPGSGGGMDDLFGGAAQEGRVRVGRAKPKSDPTGS